MAWVQRDDSGKITGYFANHQQDAIDNLEEIDENDPEVIAFFALANDSMNPTIK